LPPPKSGRTGSPNIGDAAGLESAGYSHAPATSSASHRYAGDHPRDIAIIQEELPLDIIEFFCLTPLPGSEDHQVLWKKGVAMEPDLQHVRRPSILHAQPRMSGSSGRILSRGLVDLLHPEAHGDAAASRVATGGRSQPHQGARHFATTAQLENVHPLQGGIFRLQHPSERRPGLPRERAFVFWPRFAWETLSKQPSLWHDRRRLLVLKFVITARSSRSNVPGHRAHTGR